jgi:hypothetical protein
MAKSPVDPPAEHFFDMDQALARHSRTVMPVRVSIMYFGVDIIFGEAYTAVAVGHVEARRMSAAK